MAAADAKEMAEETNRIDQMEAEDMSEDEDDMLIGNSEDEGDSDDGDDNEDDEDDEEEEDLQNLLINQRTKLNESLE